MAEKSLRLLSIGNSYSADQQRYVHQMAEAAGLDVTVGIAYFGSCSFNQHLSFYRNGEAPYRYIENGHRVALDTDLMFAINRHDWDFVTFQRGTEKKNYIFPNEPYLLELTKIVRELLPRAQFVYNESWVDAEGSVRPIFLDGYGGSREYQWEKMVEGVEDARTTCGIRYITPCGRAMQLAYETFGPRMHRDRFHSSELGRYLHACVWLEFFTGVPAPEDYLPEGGSYKDGVSPTPEECAVLRAAARRVIDECRAAGEPMPAVFRS